MTAGDLVLPAFVASIAAGMSALMWPRFNHIEKQLADQRREIAELRQDMTSFRSDFSRETTSLRSDFTHETAAMRSDLTHIALAVGANRPRATEG